MVNSAVARTVAADWITVHRRYCELPLLDILKALPPDVAIGIEVPRLSLAEAGVSHVDRLRPCVEAARGLLTESL